MRLTSGPNPADLAKAVRPILDRRLMRNADEPVAVALSGGGDSLALALIADEWARYSERTLLILTVDHGLRRESVAWAEACRAVAARLGAPFQALAWEGPKPAAGLAAAAREARHRLLAEAARKAGAKVILMGHTGSDLAEAAAMREAGSTTPDPREWAPSPAWPEGRGVFLLRPLLGLARAEIRAWLTERDEPWIDDPANADPASTRVRARAVTAKAPPPPISEAPSNPLVEACRFDPGGGVHLPREALLAAPAEQALAFVGMAAVCAGGGDSRPSGAQLERLVRLLRGPQTITASLAGARVEADFDEASFLREPGEARRGGLTQLYLTPGQPVVWDGRFEFVASRPGLYVQRLEGMSKRLSDMARKALRSIPTGARAGLPAILTGDEVVCPVLEVVPDVQVRPLVQERLFAACGLIEREPA